MERLDPAGSAAAALGLIRKVDAFINLTEPFKLARDESKREELGAILHQCLEALRIASLLLWAIMPGKMAELWEALNQTIDPAEGKLDDLAAWGGLQPGTKVSKIALFPRLEQHETSPSGK
jgi:methionyl-tRNA synthetase